MRGYKKPSASVFCSNLGNRLLTINRNKTRLEQIQKTNPDFNYDKNPHLKFYIDQMIKSLEELKTIGINNES